MPEENINDRRLYSAIPENMVGMHLCSIYRNQGELLSVTIPYILTGLERKERCAYVADKEAQDNIRFELEQAGVRPNRYIESGHLVFLTKQETYLLAGYFSAQRMIDFLEYSHYETLKNGYYSLRGASEMSWALENYPGSGKLIDYENQINTILSPKRMSALCLYDETKFPEKLLLDVLYTHPKAIIYGKTYDNPHYIPPEEFANQEQRKHSPGEYQRLRDSIISNKA